MNTIFGVFRRDHAPIERVWLNSLASAALNSSAREANIWYGDSIALGARLRPVTPEAEFATLPPTFSHGAFVLVARARLDNRMEPALSKQGWETPELCSVEIIETEIPVKGPNAPEDASYHPTS